MTTIIARIRSNPAFLAMAVLLTLGCSKGLQPETRLAAAATAFQTSERAFIAARTRVAKSRQSALNRVEMDAAGTRQQADSLVSVWRVAEEKEKLRLYQEVLAASQAASQRIEAITRLREEQAQAQAQADTRVAIDQEKLARAIQQLGQLGAGLSHREWAEFLVTFAKNTRDEVEKAAEAADAATSPAPVEETASAAPATSTPTPR